MTRLFGLDIAGLVHQAMSPGLPTLTLVKVARGTRMSTTPTAGTNPTNATYPGRGFMDSYRSYEIDNTIITADSRKIVIIGGSLPTGIVPELGDQIVLEGVTWTIESVRRDPAAATYECRVNG